FHRDGADETAADQKAVELLTNSPYKEKLPAVGLFLRALEARSAELPNLIAPHLGNGLSGKGQLRLNALTANAPSLEVRNTQQLPALPLGGRIKVDPWSDRVELVKTQAVPLLSPREKMS